MANRSDRPPYLEKKRLKDGTVAYYFNPPSWARTMGCPIPHTSLGTNKQEAYNHVWNVLYKHFLSWLTKGATDIVAKRMAEGSFEWLVLKQFPGHRAFKRLSESTQAGHLRRLRKMTEIKMPDGSTLGTWPLKDFEPEVVDMVYEILLADKKPFEVEDEFGQKVMKQPGETQANHIMKVCCRAWNVGYRSKSSIVPKENPFSKMGLSWNHDPTYKASWQQLMEFVKTADELGHDDIGTAAMVTWEFCQRPTHVFRNFLLKHYRPDAMPNHVFVVHPKNKEKVWMPLFNTSSASQVPFLIFPMLAPRLEVMWLEAQEKGRTEGPFFVREHLDAKTFTFKNWVTRGSDIGAANDVVKKIVVHAGLPDFLTLENFRHGGITELGDADLTDSQARAMTRHKSEGELPTYIEPTQKQLRMAQTRRLEVRDRQEDVITERLTIPLIAPRDVPLVPDQT